MLTLIVCSLISTKIHLEWLNRLYVILNSRFNKFNSFKLWLNHEIYFCSHLVDMISIKAEKAQNRDSFFSWPNFSELITLFSCFFYHLIISKSGFFRPCTKLMCSNFDHNITTIIVWNNFYDNYRFKLQLKFLKYGHKTFNVNFGTYFRLHQSLSSCPKKKKEQFFKLIKLSTFLMWKYNGF